MDTALRKKLLRQTGQRISAALREMQLCPKQVAAVFDITPASVRNWLNGKTDPGLIRMMELATLTHRTLESLVPDSAPLHSATAADNKNENGNQIAASHVMHVSVDVNENLVRLIQEQNETLRNQLASQQQQISSQQEQISQLIKMLGLRS